MGVTSHILNVVNRLLDCGVASFLQLSPQNSLAIGFDIGNFKSPRLSVHEENTGQYRQVSRNFTGFKDRHIMANRHAYT